MHIEPELDLSDIPKLIANDEDFVASLFEGTPALPGSEDKVTVLLARYASGLPLWNDNDAKPAKETDAEKHRETFPFPWLVAASSEELSEASEPDD